MDKLISIDKIRRQNLQMLIDESEERTAVALAAKCGTDSSYLSQILTCFPMKSGNPRVLGTRLARKLEKGCGKPEGWMDQRHDDIDPGESELVHLYGRLNENMRKILLEQARTLTKITE